MSRHPNRKQRRSGTVTLSLLAAVALALGACGPPNETQSITGPTDVRRCVDKDNKVVEDNVCDEIYSGHPHVYSTPHFWYYGGYSPGVGQVVNGGGYMPAAGRNYITPTGKPAAAITMPSTPASRGGIGTTGSSGAGKVGGVAPSSGS